MGPAAERTAVLGRLVAHSSSFSLFFFVFFFFFFFLPSASGGGGGGGSGASCFLRGDEGYSYEGCKSRAAAGRRPCRS